MSIRARFLAPTLIALGATTAACSTPPSGQAASNDHPSTSAVPATSSLTSLQRSLHPLALPKYDVGRRDPSIVTAGSIFFKLSDAQRADRDALLTAVQDPSSPSYHKWLSVEDYATRFGARTQDIARVRAWLESQGLTIDKVSRTGSRIQFRGAGGQIEAAFRTEIHNYDIAGTHHYAMASAPQIPSELAPAVLGLKGFHDFHLHSMAKRPTPGATDPIYGETALAPADFATLYNTKPLDTAGTTGTGINLVIIGQTYFTPSDISNFRKNYGFTSVNEVDVLVPNTGTQAIRDTGDEGETELDLEWSSAVAPGANIVFVYTGNDKNFSVDDSVMYAVEEGAHLVPGTGNGAAQIISESYGGCDLDYAGTDADVDGEIAAAANLQGITYLAASGDSAATGCLGGQGGSGGLYTGPPADMPGVTAVGGTEFCGGSFAPGESAGCYYSEAPIPNVQTAPWFVNQDAVEYPISPGGLALEGAWNDSTIQYGPGGGGGAPSIIFPKPAYQQFVAGMPNDGARDVPDVALTASANNLGYLIWGAQELPDGGTADELGPIGGTSAATPSFAGILARVSQAVHAAHPSAPLGLGNVNPQLYALFSSNGTTGAFHDIAIGDNIVPCDATDTTDYPGCPLDGGVPGDDGGIVSSYGGFKAHAGYDLTSGLGSVDATKLVAAWVGLNPTSTALTAPSTAPEGTPVTLSATVTASAGTAPIGGTVTFAFMTLAGDAGAPYSFDAGGGPDEAWVLGTVDVTAQAGSPEKATASLSTAIPPGLYGQAYLVAEYSGDTSYLASNSPLSGTIPVTGATLAIAPLNPTVAPNGQLALTVTGNKGAVTWGIEGTDSTCAIVTVGKHHEEICSNVEPTSPTTAAFQAGGQDGTVAIVAIDGDGQEAVTVITAAGAAIDGGTLPNVDDAGPQGGPVGNPPIPEWDGSAPTVDAGTWGFPSDAGAAEDGSTGTTGTGPVTTPVDSGTGPTNGSNGNDNSGCSCVVAGADGGRGESGGATVGGTLLGLAFLGRRRNRRR